MKFTVDRKALLTELRLASLITAKKQKKSLPVLKCLKLVVANGILTLTKTDLDTTGVFAVQVAKSKSGECLVDATTLLNIVSATPAELLSFATIQDGSRRTLSVTAGAAVWTILAESVEAFPDIPAMPKRSLNLPFDTFLRHIQKVRFAVTKDTGRFTLSGLKGLKFVVNGELTLVATDGHRLAITTDRDIQGDIDVLLPVKATDILARFPKGEEVGIGTDPGYIGFEIDNRILVSRVLSGTFPKYEAVIPNDSPFAGSFDAIAMDRVCREAGTVASRRGRMLRWALSPTGVSELTADDYDNGSYKTELVTNYAGDPLSLGFNTDYLLDLCSRNKGSVIRMAVKDSNSAAVFSVGNDFRYVLMPLRI